jgi:hypothetical protein
VQTSFIITSEITSVNGVSLAEDSHFSSGSDGGKSAGMSGQGTSSAVARFKGGSLPNGVSLDDNSAVRCINVPDPAPTILPFLQGNCMPQPSPIRNECESTAVF